MLAVNAFAQTKGEAVTPSPKSVGVAKSTTKEERKAAAAAAVKKGEIKSGEK